MYMILSYTYNIIIKGCRREQCKSYSLSTRCIRQTSEGLQEIQGNLLSLESRTFLLSSCVNFLSHQSSVTEDPELSLRLLHQGFKKTNWSFQIITSSWPVMVFWQKCQTIYLSPSLLEKFLLPLWELKYGSLLFLATFLIFGEKFSFISVMDLAQLSPEKRILFDQVSYHFLEYSKYRSYQILRFQVFQDCDSRFNFDVERTFPWK